MAYCHIHNTYHNGTRAKMTCILSITRGIPLDNAVEKVNRRVDDPAFHRLRTKVNKMWEEWDYFKEGAESILKFNSLFGRESPSFDDRLLLTKSVIKKSDFSAVGRMVVSEIQVVAGR